MKVEIEGVKYGSSMLIIHCTDGKQITISLYGNSAEVRRSFEAFAEKVRQMVGQMLEVVADWRRKTLQIGHIIFAKPDDDGVTEINFTLPAIA